MKYDDRPLILTPDEVLEIIRDYVEDHMVFGKRRKVRSICINGEECVVTFQEELSTVWHVLPAHFCMGKELRFPSHYECVATVASKDLGKIFELTNHINHEWWTNEGVTCMKKSRSTSVGDVVVMSDKKTLYLCMPTGWKQYYGVPQIFNTGLDNDEDD